MLLFYVLSFFKKGGTIQGGTLSKGGGGHYLRKYGIGGEGEVPNQTLSIFPSGES